MRDDGNTVMKRKRGCNLRVKSTEEKENNKKKKKAEYDLQDRTQKLKFFRKFFGVCILYD